MRLSHKDLFLSPDAILYYFASHCILYNDCLQSRFQVRAETRASLIQNSALYLKGYYALFPGNDVHCGLCTNLGRT